MSNGLNYSVPKSLNHKGVKAAFFYAHDKCNQEVNFSSPLKGDLVTRVLSEFGLKRLLVLNQTHSSHITIYPSQDEHRAADGIITAQKGVGLLIRHADCQAALIYDPIKNVIAAVHAGFRGQASGIYTTCVKRLEKEFGSTSHSLQVALSPSLGLCHSEFINYQDEFPKSLHHYASDQHMDLKQMALDEFMNAGVLRHNIDLDPRCTFDNDKDFFSYRKTKTSKRLGSLIALS